MSAQPRILRVAILREGRILEERLFRKHQSVTIGRSPKATLSVPIEGMPERQVLFRRCGDRMCLLLDGASAGRISLQGTVHALAELNDHRDMTIQRGRRVLTLDPTSRGKIQVGGVTVLFQLVTPPRTLPRAPLPASARGGLGHALRSEQNFLGTVVASLVVQLGFVALSVAMESPDDPIERQKRFVQVLHSDVEYIPTPEEERDEPEAPTVPELTPEELVPPETAEAVQTPPEEPQPRVVDAKPVPRRTAVAKTRAKKPAKRSGSVGSSVRKNYLHTIKTAMEGVGGPDTLNRGLTSRMKTAFDPAAPLKVAASTADRNGFGGGPKHVDRAAVLAQADKASPRIRLSKPDRRPKRRVKRENRIKLRVRNGPARKVAGTGGNRNVRQVFKRRMSAVKRCYESRLRVRPDLRGKIVLSFTISGAGRITRIRATSNTTNDSATAQCILRKVRGWRFDEDDKGGSASFKVPIVLQKGG